MILNPSSPRIRAAGNTSGLAPSATEINTVPESGNFWPAPSWLFMIALRPDWCISRQRTWGVPILALICESCDTAYNDADWMRSVAAKFADHERGCDWWFEAALADIVPAGLTCPTCGGTHFRKETDILDVWFDSGTSFAAVLEARPELAFPADLYLEGSDQHRGWFHSSLLAALGVRGTPPYRQVLTHDPPVSKK